MLPQELYSRFIEDPEFRRRFLSDPQTVAQDAGYALDASIVESIRAMKPRSVDTTLGDSRVSLLSV